MANTTTCDGCGIEVLPTDAGKGRVGTQGPDDRDAIVLDFDLCRSCLKTMRLYFNPKIWPRHSVVHPKDPA